MSQITVLLADLPSMLEDMVSSVLQQRSDFRVIRAAGGDRNLIDAAVKVSAQVVVVARSDPDDLGSIAPHLANAANIALVVLAPNGASACLHKFTPKQQRLDDVSAEQILAAIANAVPMGQT